MNAQNYSYLDNDEHPFIATDLDSIGEHLLKFDKINKFSTLTVNICSMRKNLNLLLAFLSKVNFVFDFIILNEIWLSPEVDIGLDIPDYQCFKLYRNTHRGGVAIFILQKYSAYVLQEYSILNNSFESLFVNINISKNYQLCLGTVYRPPRTNLNDFNDSLRNFILSKIK